MGDSAINIREMSEEDVEGILEIERQTKEQYRSVTYAPVPDSCIGGEVDNSIVVEDNGRIIGFVLARTVRSPVELKDVAWIELIGILPEYQRRGIGKRMVEAWKERCRQKGINKVHIMINWRDWWMQSFFESRGFSRGDLVDFQAEL
jgi:N-acetylglutamate synthase-like GNAT family acetyltransferase